MDMVIGFFGSLGLSVTIAWAVVIGELLTGLGLIFGIWSKVAAAGATIIMIGAVYYSKGDSKAIITLVASVITLLAGGGQYAVSRCKCSDKTNCCKTNSCTPETTPVVAEPTPTAPTTPPTTPSTPNF